MGRQSRDRVWDFQGKVWPAGVTPRQRRLRSDGLEWLFVAASLSKLLGLRRCWRQRIGSADRGIVEGRGMHSTRVEDGQSGRYVTWGCHGPRAFLGVRARM